jgi:hypothetical protein
MTRRDLFRTALTGAFAAAAGTVQRAKASAGGGDRANFRGASILARLEDKAKGEGWAGKPFGDLVAAIALELLDTPYVGFTVELYEDREVCVVNLEGLDCVTLFENSLGIARMLVVGESGPDALLRQIALTRYRGGILADYPSRLHYTSDWFLDNEAKGTVRLLSRELPGARRFEKRIDFMSTNPEKYRQLKARPELVPMIARQEAALMAKEMYFVPKEHVAKAERDLKTGDIVGITTSAQGLDCSHTGLCYRDADGALRFLHASSAKKRVILDGTLSQYVNGGGGSTGVMIARPLRSPAR